MLQKFIRRYVHRSHPWRVVGFDELSEVYVSQMLRTFAVSIVGVFTPYYLYQSGMPLRSVFFFLAWWFFVRIPIIPLCAYVIAFIGPKKTFFVSSLLHLMYLVGLFMYPSRSVHPLVLATLGSTAIILHIQAMYIDFSKIKHSIHGGSEIGALAIFEKLGGVLGPVIGGVIAGFYSPKYSFVVAMIVLVLSSAPLFYTKERMKIRQHITLSGFKKRRALSLARAAVPLAIENGVSVTVWPLFVAVFVFGSNAFVKLGVIVSVSTLSALLTARLFGVLIDKSRGRALLRLGVTMNALLHIGRLFVGTALHVLGVNIANESFTAMYRMPYLKGLFDAADDLPGYRIVFMSFHVWLESFGLFLFWVAMWMLSSWVAIESLMRGSFLLAACCSLAIMSERFAALKHKR